MNEFLHNLKDLFIYDASNPLLFNTGAFLVFFIVFIIIYTAIHKRKWSVSIFVIAFSIFFYYKSSGIYFFILVLTTITDFSFAYFLHKSKKKTFRVFWMIMGVIPSLALLGYFKYTNFILFNWSAIVQNNFQPLDIFLPIGISFYTFQSVSYVLDVYWGKVKPTSNILDYAFFLSFFPQLVAGPIVKAHEFIPQIYKEKKVTKEEVYSGMWLIMIGLIKKAVIADYISQYNDLVFASPETYSGFENLMAIYGYTLQIYCDFSGYSDIAIGLARIMGYDLGLNFNFPYKALNITDFWRRWHISLSTWLRNYLYIPLGGNRKGKWKMYRNLMLTMLIGGLWHGANWKFVFWGALHGIALAVHKASKKVLDKIPNNIFSNFFAWFFTFHFVIFLWIFFRATDVQKEYVVTEIIEGTEQEIVKTETIDAFNVSWMMIGRIFTDWNGIDENNQLAQNEIDIDENTEATTIDFSDKVDSEHNLEQSSSIVLHFISVRYVWVILLIIGFLMHASPDKWTEKIINSYIKSPYILKVILFIVVVQLCIQFKNSDVQPFIYFQF